ncbi:conserved oligomeric Golgi complex subunit 1 isoform X2 [Rhinatrema bivittatum]|uniref:conserved oligomeric Golgi complex subunit 1 isoform X2 n=1 Tax=Rhinatrema bivittatum TaxID=194408 RepID=UPI00112A32D1|nr:conserved oligomeric Golgi complex subunit 1 isoform X2 [Rhinatrema bivittatum]
MAAVPAQSLKAVDIREPAALFEAYGAEEIRGIERRLRAGIEQKKEELRQMVGERYRDLIEAADTIGDMRHCCGQVLGSVQDMHRTCSALRRGPRGEQTPVRSQEKFYSMAAQIKLLLEIPEQIWSCMEASQSLRATQLYLLCCHLHSLLQLDSSGSRYSPILARFPILVRQVAAAGHFRATILQESKSLLKCPTVSDQAVAEALCAIMFLEDSSPRQALADFLLARKAAIQQLLNQPHHGAGIKAQVCSVVELLATTLYQAHALFYTLPEGVSPDPALPCAVLFSTLETATGQYPKGQSVRVLQEEMKSGSWFKYLPSSILDFQPALRTLAHPISRDYLRDTLQKWISMCSEDIKASIATLLVYIKTLKGLAGIRDAVWELLSSESMRNNWETVCCRLLDGPLRFWEDLLQQLFLARLQTLTKEGFDSISSSSKQLLLSALQELVVKSNKYVHFEYDMASFLWSESLNDLPSDAAWVSVANRNQFAKSGLSMKARGLTPCVQSFCSALDAKLKVQLDDLLSYLPSDPSASKEPSISSLPAQMQHSAFDRYMDASIVEEMLRSHCLACVEYILSCLEGELQNVQGSLENKDTLDIQLSPVLFMARLCQSLGELCPHLKQCILGKSGSSEQALREARPIKKLGKGKIQETNPVLAKWQEVKEKLLQQSLAAYRIWSLAVVNALVQSFTQTLLLESAGSILTTATNWEETEIQEETESGSTVTSKIRLPVQASWYVQSLLFSLCQEINRVGGHAFPKVTLHVLLRSCLTEVTTSYEKLSLEKQHKNQGLFPMTQNRALQLLFDLRYLSILLTPRSEDVKGSKSKQDVRIQKVADLLESHIDPFDLDVFMPYLNSNLNRLAQRTSVLFGLLTGAENQYTARSAPFSTQEVHNILPLATSQIRFGLLPLSMSSSRKAKSGSRITETIRAPVPSPLSIRAEEESFQPGSLFKQLATQEDDISTPSLFKLGWLSSMTK